MHDWRSLWHLRWDCKYHLVFVPKYRKKALYGKLRSQLGEIQHDQCRQKGVDLLAGHAMLDHIPLCLSIAPRYIVSQVIGHFKAKSSSRIHRGLSGHRKLTGPHFCSSRHCVSIVSFDEATLGKYTREQDKIQQNQMALE